jgi:hypothetical protein
LKIIFDDIVAKVFSSVLPVEDIIKILIDPDEGIVEVVNSVTDNMIYAVEMNTDNAFFNKLKNFTDGLIDCLKDEFPDEKLNPYLVGDI